MKFPVASLNYISKLCPDLEDLLQRPNASFDVGESTWYCKSPLGKNTLASMMSEISHIALLSMTYTNHSIRATSITVMNLGGVTGRHIMKVSGQRSEDSLKSYSNRVSDKKKRGRYLIFWARQSLQINRSINSSEVKNVVVEKTEVQPIPPQELLELFSNDIELEEVNENVMSDLNLMQGLNTINKSCDMNDNRTKHCKKDAWMCKWTKPIRLSVVGQEDFFPSFPDLTTACSVNVTVNNNQAN